MRVEIATALQELQLPPEDLMAVRSTHYHSILNRILETFTRYGSQGRNQMWLWEGFKGERYAVHLTKPEGCEWLPRLVLPDERVWFLTEDWHGQKHDGNYWLFEGRIGAIAAILRELFCFEYYVVAKDFQWLICETHHNVLIGVGPHMTERLRVVKASLATGSGR